MFNSKKKSYTRKVRIDIDTSNDFNEPIEEYAAAANINMFISLSNEITLSSQDMRIQQCSHIGLTNDVILAGDIIDDKYEVQFVNKAGREKIVYMKELENNGSFN